MLDINLLRNDLDGVAAGLAKRGVALDTARFDALEAERKDIQTRTQELQAKRNALSKQIGVAKGKGEDAAALMAEGRRHRRRAEAARSARSSTCRRSCATSCSTCPTCRTSVPVGKSRRRQRRSAPLGHAARVRLSR